MALVIRPAEPADAPRLGHVHVAAWQWAYRGLMPDDVLDSLRPESRARAWKAWLGPDATEDFSAWVAEVDGEIVGFASSSLPRDEDLPEGSVELLSIYLLEDHVGTGVGSALLEAAEDAWRKAGAEYAVLWVMEGNARTIRFYERHGWKADGESRGEQVAEGTTVPVVRYVKPLA